MPHIDVLGKIYVWKRGFLWLIQYFLSQELAHNVA